MSKTFKQTRMRKLKTAIVERRNLVEQRTESTLSLGMRAFQDAKLIALWGKFWNGALRYGNKRKSVAKDKVYLRRKERRQCLREDCE